MRATPPLSAGHGRQTGLDVAHRVQHRKEREHSAHTTRPHARQWWRPENRFRLLNWVPQPAMAHSNASLSGCQYFLAICRAGRAGDALHAASRLSCARGVVAFNSAACSGSPGEPTGWLAAAAASWTIVSAVLICRRPAMLLSGAPGGSCLSDLSPLPWGRSPPQPT